MTKILAYLKSRTTINTSIVIQEGFLEFFILFSIFLFQSASWHHTDQKMKSKLKGANVSDGEEEKKISGVPRGLLIAAAILAVSWNTIDHVKNLAWEAFLDYYGDDGATLWTRGTTQLVLGLYWSVGLLFAVMDLTNWPKCLRKYKVQPGTNEPVDIWKLMKVIWQVNINLIVVTIPFIWICSFLMLVRQAPGPREPTYMLSGTIQVLFCALCEETMLYYVHRIMHHRYFYKYIHKQHHEWTSPVAITAIYCSKTEHIFANLIPVFFGVLFLGTHVLVAWVWISITIVFTLIVHSGYHLPFMPSPEFHDFHHHNFTSCFGFSGFLDKLHGTDAAFKKSDAYNRHGILTSTKSAWEVSGSEKVES